MTYARCPYSDEMITIDNLSFKLHGAQGACSNDYIAEYEINIDKRDALSDAIYIFSFSDDDKVDFQYSKSQLESTNGIIQHKFNRTSCGEPNDFFKAKVEVYCNSKLYGSATIENVKVIMPPVANFENPDPVCVNEIVDFNNTSERGKAWDCSDNMVSEWEFGDGSSSNLDSPSHKYTAPGTYKVKLTVHNVTGLECSYTIKEKEIRVIDLAKLDRISDISICAGEKVPDILVTGNTMLSKINWNVSKNVGLTDGSSDKKPLKIGSFTAKNSSNTIISSLVTVTPYNELGCPGDTIQFNIFVKPSPAIDPIEDVEVCAGEEVSAIAFSSPVAGTTFTWTNSNPSIGLAASGSGNIPSFTANNSTNKPITAEIKVTSSNSDPQLKDCGGVTSSFNITVNPTPVFTVKGVDPTKCGVSDGQIILSGLGELTTYTVKYGTVTKMFTSDTSGKITIPALGPGKYSPITVSIGKCTNTIYDEVLLDSPSAPEIPTFDMPAQVCEGDNVNLISHAADGVTYSWKGPNGWSSTSQNPTITSVGVSSSGTYTLSVIKNNCESGIVSHDLKVKQDPKVSLLSIPNSCVGSNLNIDPTYVKYTWNDAAESQQQVTWSISPSDFSFESGTNEHSKYPTIRFNKETTYNVSVTIGSIGCSGANLTSTQTVKVLDGGFELKVDADKLDGCVPLSVKMSNSTTSSDITYSWKVTPVSGWSYNSGSASSDAPEFAFTAPGDYIISVDAANKCGNQTKSFDVHTIKDPEVSLSSFNKTCKGTELNLSEYVTYEWYNVEDSKKQVTWNISPSTFSYKNGTTENSSAPVVVFDEPGQYSVQVSVGSIGCSGSKLSAKEDITIIDGDFNFDVALDKYEGCVNLNLKALNNTLDASEATYKWSIDKSDGWIYGTGSSETSKSPLFTFTKKGTYKISVSAKNICGVKTKEFTVVAHKQLEASLQNIKDVCGKYSYDTKALSSIVGDLEDINKVEWKVAPSDEVVFEDETSTPVINFNKPGNYTLTQIIDAYCGAIEAKATISIDEPIEDITITPISTLCANVKSEQNQNPVSLVAIPTDGTWSFEEHPDWLNVDKFIPNQPGTYELLYTVVRGSCSAKSTLNIKVRDYPTMSIGDNIRVCLNDETPVPLEATIAGGVWSGEGVQCSDRCYYQPLTSVGTTNINYKATDTESGCKVEMDKKAIVQGLPDPEFGPLQHCLPGEMVFDTKSDASNSFLFSYGDGASDGTGSHLYAGIGNYEVKLIVTAGSGCQDSASHIVKVEGIPAPSFELDKHKGCSPLEVQITPSVDVADATGTTYAWDFGVKGTFDELNPGSKTFTARGYDSIYVINFTVSNFCGSTTVTDEVEVLATPGADFEAEQTWFCSPVEIAFQNKTVGSMEGRTYLWDFGDGTTSTERFPVHTFATDYYTTTTYHVRLSATNVCGTDYADFDVLVKPQNIKAQFANPAPISCVGEELCFANNSIGISEEEPITSSVWDFGNGTSSSEWNGCTKFTSPGRYKVTLVVSNACGRDVFESYVEVQPGPVIDIKSPTQICISDTLYPEVKIQDENIAGIVWDFGNGDREVIASPEYLYDAAGEYMLKVTVTADNVAKCKSSDSTRLKVIPLPNPIISPFEYDSCSPIVYTPKYSEQYFVMVDYEGNGKATSALSHEYHNTGLEPVTYVTKFYFEDKNGCKAKQEGKVIVYPEPVATIGVGSVEKSRPEVVQFLNESYGADECEWILPYAGTINSTDDQTESFYTNELRTIYLTALNKYGCVSRDSVDYQPVMKGLYFPNTFSPYGTLKEVQTFNGVGMGLKMYRLQVFDLYGNVIYQTTSIDSNGAPDQGWDGRDIHGRMMPQDVYTWKAEAIFIDGSEYPFGNDVDNVPGSRVNDVTLYRGSVLLLSK